MIKYLRDIYEAVWSALKGMRITFRHLFKKPVTLQYPDERWVLPDRFRGFIYNDTNRCDGCRQCAKACPVDCIYIETIGKGADRFMYRYAVDFNKCIWCGHCTVVCPTSACQHSHDYDHSLYSREDLVYEYVDPKNPVPCNKKRRLEMGYYVPNAEAERQKIAEKKALADAEAAAAVEAPESGAGDEPPAEGKGD